ncbi:MAG: gephyrin-like molybdotransferase Glp [Candidatus Azotimanducaceae bacterium]|uniref:Molybdopterin molybdenumtransferase n=1 Tax=OM182 bacterium TaxID=2510334 RepID=A0A520S4U4_9GAMM|nr:molybdopterin molybdenumtransferase MoeA [Gammaproteobacteria bacterium]OUV68297.1 MAG: hypothetical protein CBC93_02925 [Gammaproteobacteria bacterium TMED133]RZO77470.1 MAG: molybdopterin molybdenumtransferase MoeA [OM182 bacterium]
MSKPLETAYYLSEVNSVIEELLGLVNPTGNHLTVDLDESSGKYLARDVRSQVFLPPVASSAMDGYAVCAESITLGQSYEVSDRIAAGSVGQPLVPGTLAKIFTGAPIPQGSDSVVIQEDTSSNGDLVKINKRPSLGENVRPQGQDINKGQIIFSEGHRLAPKDLGLIASVGLSKIDIFQPLEIAIISTGNELIEPPYGLGPGKIYNGNRYTLAALLQELGMKVIDIGIVEDDFDATCIALAKAADQSDCVLCTGGVSVGEEDHVRAAVESLGSLDIWQLAIKPGKPLAFGSVNGKPFFGLPGNPVSTFVTFLMITRPYLIALQGGAKPLPIYYYGLSDFEFQSGRRREYLRVRLTVKSTGEVWLSKYSNQSSGIMSSVTWADALAEVDIGQQIRFGDKIKYYLI